MPIKRGLLLGVMVLVAFIMQGCTAGFLGFGGGKLRSTNVEVKLYSQSCFQGEIVPCG